MIDPKKIKYAGAQPKMQDPIRFPKIVEPIEKQMKENYIIQLNKMLTDITKKLVEFKQ